MFRLFHTFRIGVLSVVVLAAPVWGQNNQTRPQSAGTADVRILQVRDDIYMLTTPDGNIAASVGPDGILMVDAGPAQLSDKILAALATLNAPKPIRFIINTSADPDRVGGDAKLAKSGITYDGEGRQTDATMMAFQKTLDRMISDNSAGGALQQWDTYSSSMLKMFTHFNGEPVELVHVPAAHTDADSIVVFRRADVIVAGDILSTTSYPKFNIETGGSIQGTVNGLIRLTDLAILDFLAEGGTLIVPGHGRICDAADVAYIRDMTIIIRDRVAKMIKEGKTLAQVQAAGLTREYDSRYDTPGWTKDMFLEAVYKSLKSESPKEKTLSTK